MGVGYIQQRTGMKTKMSEVFGKCRLYVHRQKGKLASSVPVSRKKTQDIRLVDIPWSTADVTCDPLERRDFWTWLTSR